MIIPNTFIHKNSSITFLIINNTLDYFHLDSCESLEEERRIKLSNCFLWYIHRNVFINTWNYSLVEFTEEILQKKYNNGIPRC